LSVSIRADVSPVQKLVLAGLNNAFSGSDIRSLIDEIGLVPDDGELRIEIKGELAGILELCQEGTK
jgi:hypothetical protein